MRRLCGRVVVIFALVVSLSVSSLSVFGQMPYGGGGGYGGGGRGRGFRRMFPGGMPMVIPQQPEVKPEEKKDEKKDEKKEEKKPDPGPKPVIRPPAIENPSALADQKMRIDDKKMVSFNFQEAPWTFVMEELSRVSNMNLDWQQLPGDALNLRSNGKYPVPQMRDIINEALLARGYSMLVDNKTSTINVVNLERLNSALVPRVAPEDLESLAPHDLVKVSFRLDWMMADKAVDEFKPMLSSNGKLVALKSTNRLEAIDAVENLRQVAALLDEEQGGKKGDHFVREFELRYTRASEVVEQLENFMGIKKDSANVPKNMQGQPIMVMPMPGQPGQPGQPAQQPGQPPKPEIRLLALHRHNSVLANAPPDQMAIIRAAIYRIDVPSERPSLSENGQMMNTYRLATLDPEVVVNFLESVGDLDPQTKLEADKKNRAVIAYASPRDHKAIASLVKNLDGTDRELHVIKLRKLDADMVAGTIKALLVGEDKSASSGGGSRRYGYGWFSPFGGNNNNQDDQPTTKFRVEADVVANRLLVFSNKIELEQVEKCLAQLGEVPRREGSAETLRVLDFGASDDEQQLLERLRRAWPALGKDGNKLIIDVPARKPEKTEQPTQEDPKVQPAPKKDASAPSASNFEPNGVRPHDAKLPIRFVGLQTGDQLAQADAKKSDKSVPELEPQDTPRSNVAPLTKRSLPDAASPDRTEKRATTDEKSVPGDPIYITRGADGKLVISSRDAKALDQLEEVMARLAPPRKDYEVFYMHYASASSMKYMLDDFFAVEKKESSADKRFRSWWNDDSSDKKDDAPRLSQRRPLKFIDDDASNSILVQGGTPEQLRRIADVIKLYDRPEKPNTRASRITKHFLIKHSKASIVGDVIKDIYRDLLSANDKALESYNQSKNQGSNGRGRGFTYIYDFGDREDEGKINQGRFKGYLSLAPDDTTNSLLVSCPAALMANVEQIIQYLDQAAVPAAQTFQVLKLDRGMDANSIQKKLTEMLKPSAPKTEQHPQTPQPNQQQGQRRGRNQRQGGDSSGNSNNNNNE